MKLIINRQVIKNEYYLAYVMSKINPTQKCYRNFVCVCCKSYNEECKNLSTYALSIHWHSRGCWRLNK